MRTQPTLSIRTCGRRQAGVTLIELVVVLVISALVIGGALAAFSGASSSQTATQMTADLSAIRASTKSLYFGQGGYGTTAMTEVLINGKKIPNTMTISGAAPNRVVTHSLNGALVVTGANAQFTVSAAAIPTDICIGLATMSGWDSVKIGANAARTPPVSTATASTDCSSASTQTIVFTGS
jgi:prepilin-type N-terminal cleavage/methylation domain-containing protein